MDNLLKHKVQRVKYTIPKKNNKLLVKKEEEEEERSNYQKFPKGKKKSNERVVGRGEGGSVNSKRGAQLESEWRES